MVMKRSRSKSRKAATARKKSGKQGHPQRSSSPKKPALASPNVGLTGLPLRAGAERKTLLSERTLERAAREQAIEISMTGALGPKRKAG
jgi:hypothetical protein